jgi:hypothetical protein
MSTKARNRPPSREQPVPGQEAESDLLRLRQAIDHAADLLPAQGPVTVFIHHNTLHAFEHLPFTEVVKRAARVFGCQPYLSEDRYRQEMGRGRIRFADLEAARPLVEVAARPPARRTRRWSGPGGRTAR